MISFLQSLAPPTNVTGPVLVAYVLFDIFLIVVLGRLLGSLMVRLKQPRVVGEILAGIMIGPTLLGATLSLVIAPLEARPVLNVIGTLALVLFMFLAGLEYDASQVKGRVGRAGTMAVLAIAIPALLGFPVAMAMYTAAYAGPGAQSFLPFALFMGAALSVTAFPVMAHILMERGELNTPIGALAMASTGIMSVLMFVYISFAATVATANGLGGIVQSLFWIAVFGLASWFVVRPLLARWLADAAAGSAVTGDAMAGILGGMVLYGLIAHIVGINALVGAFFWGLILPAEVQFRQVVAAKVRDLAMVFFLPVFFAMSGFATNLRLLTAETLPIAGLVLLAAVASKFGAVACMRAFGSSWREVTIIGALFNTRGLLVLVVGLIGLQLEIITALTFTILAVVALSTNLMTLPLLNLADRWPQARTAAAAQPASPDAGSAPQPALANHPQSPSPLEEATP